MLLAGETGATAGHVNMKDIRRLPLGVLPQKPTQKRLGEVIGAYDDLIENNERRIGLLKTAAQLLYNEWFGQLRFPGHEHVHRVDGIPAGWERRLVSDVAELKYGKALKEENRVAGSVPVYGSSGVVGSHTVALSSGPSIVVGRKGNVGTVHCVSGSFWPIDTVYYVPCELADPWLFFTLPLAGFQNTDGGVPGLNRDFAYSRKVTVPERNVRRNFNEQVGPLFELQEKLASYNRKLEEARDLLLPRLMSGEMAV
jgi:type I restriction enzyme S subunit